MDEASKRAYRHLLYRAMLDIRPIAWMPLGFFRLLNPFAWRRTVIRIREAGEIADYLHNLAHFSALDFEHFDEEWFWRELNRFNEVHPPRFGRSSYREEFERVLSK
jgi:hypothetical protein